MHSNSFLTPDLSTAKMSFMSLINKIKEGNSIIFTIHRYRKDYVSKNLLPDLYCTKNDGTHLPLISRMDARENVYLYCLTCDWEKRAGMVTESNLKRLMDWRDAHPDSPVDSNIVV